MTDQFRALLIKAIDVREKVLMPENPLFGIAQSVQDEEVTRQEQKLLNCLLGQYDLLQKVRTGGIALE